MIVSGVIVSGAQQSNSVIHIHIPILPQTPLLFKLSYNIEELYISFSFWASALAKQTLASILLTYGVFSLHGWKEKSHHLNISCFPGGSGGKESACNAGDLGSISGLGRSSGGRHGNPLQYSCLKNSMDRGTWWAAVCAVVKSRTWLSN